MRSYQQPTTVLCPYCGEDVDEYTDDDENLDVDDYFTYFTCPTCGETVSFRDMLKVSKCSMIYRQED